MAQIIIFFIISIPLYAALIWSFLEPRESLLFGKRWMYKEEPDISEGALIYTKIASIAGMVLLTLFFFLIAIISKLR